ncbi:MAG: class I SAM-dependent methyltransferase, partial [Phycisphaerales bacterium]
MKGLTGRLYPKHMETTSSKIVRDDHILKPVVQRDFTCYNHYTSSKIEFYSLGEAVMKAMCSLLTRVVCVLLASGMVLTAATRAGEYPEQARRILDATGVGGGLISHIGCRDGKLTAAFRVSDKYLVHGLDHDPNRVAEARGHVEAGGFYGTVAIDSFDNRHLPYVDNSVNLIVAEKPTDVPAREINRVLRPGGVSYLKRNKRWMRQVKPWPTDLDQWSHCLHGPDNNAVANDAHVGPPRSLQWAGPPAQARQHENLASVSAVVSSGGRVFSIQDESSTASLLFPAKWFLVARDAFNGV